MATGTNGLIEHVYWGLAAANTCAGKVMGGEMPLDPNLRSEEAIAGQRIIEGGQFHPEVSFDVELQSIALVQDALRASLPAGALTANKFDIGNTAAGTLLSGGKINTCSVAFAFGGAMTASFNIRALTAAAGATTAHGSLAGQAWRWFEGQCTLGGAQKGIMEATININNNVDWEEGDTDTKAAASLRIADALKVGIEEITLDVVTKVDPAEDLDADYIANNVAAVIRAVNGVKHRTFTFANLTPGPFSRPIMVGNTIVGYKQSYVGIPGSLVITTADA